jgi:hypothetical protein
MLSYFILAMVLPVIKIINVFIVNVYILLFLLLIENFDLC